MGYVLAFLQIAVLVTTVYAFVHAALQRADAYTAAEKLTKPVWLVILGVPVCCWRWCSASPAWRSRRLPRASISSTSGPRSWKSRASPDSRDALPRRRRDRGSSPVSRRWRPVAAADPVPGPPYIDHVQWAKWGDMSSLRVYPTAVGTAGVARGPTPGASRRGVGRGADAVARRRHARHAGPVHVPLGVRRARPARQDQLEPRAVATRGRRRRTMVDDALQPRRHRRTVLVPHHSRVSVSPRSSTTRCSNPRRPRPTSSRCSQEADELGVFAVCVSPSMVATAKCIPDGRVCHRVGRGIPVRQAPFGDQGRGGSAGGRGGRRRDRHGDRRRMRPSRRLRRGARRRRGGLRRDAGRTSS